MTSLHALFSSRNQQAFQRLLESSRASSSSASQGLSSSGGKSWNRPSPLSSNTPPVDVNSRDWLGRTVLHIACSASDPAATEHVRLLLTHPAINVNLPDAESHWTALHRALYHGNLASAILLLQRPDIDYSIKDQEGYTAFDLYNSTVEHTKPTLLPTCHYPTDRVSGDRIIELYTWGSNRNAALGSGAAGDRITPEQVTLRQIDGEGSLVSRFTPMHIRQVVMSKLHTAVVTGEAHNNVRVCGFGSGGRLGPSNYMQYDLVPLQQIPDPVILVALGQDHTLALTASRSVYSWGLNRFSQLGYVVEQIIGDERIQLTPKRIAGPIKHKSVYGVAACKTASACWTRDELYTWGTNNGQLGYDKAANPVQALPRLVAKVTLPVTAISITESAMACLLESKEVICLWNDRHAKINFHLPAFPPDIAVYLPVTALRTEIVKITSCENTFGALSHTGDLFIFTPTEVDTTAGAKDGLTIKPHRVSALRRQSSAVKDFALGSDGSIIICTESGHVFVRSRNLKASQAAAKVFKFQRIPFIHRVFGVCANSTGAFGALKHDFRPEPIEVVGNSLEQDLSVVTPFLHPPPHHPTTLAPPHDSHTIPPASVHVDVNDCDAFIQHDIRKIFALCDLLSTDRQARKDTGRSIFDNARHSHGPDLMVQVQSGLILPVHRFILSCRCSILGRVASGIVKIVQDQETNIVIKAPHGRAFIAKPSMALLTITGCQPLSVLILLEYLYSDQVLALWDPRISSAVEREVRKTTTVNADKIKSELQVLARVLDLPLLGQVLEAPIKKVPIQSMVADLKRVHEETQDSQLNSTHRPDVVLDLADKQVFCHSVLLRARSPLFAAFFDDEDWTVNRWGVDGTVVVNLKHLEWRATQFLVRFLCCGEDQEMFEALDSVSSVDELLDLMFDIMAAASELLIDRLVLICSRVILRHINVNNVCAVLSDATHYAASALIEKAEAYMAVNMETLLESRMLDDLSSDLIRQLSTSVRREQAQKSPFTRSTSMIDKAMMLHGDWLALQDIPEPITRSNNRMLKDSTQLLPPGTSKRNQSPSNESPMTSPATVPTSIQSIVPPGEDIFVMDDEEPPSPRKQPSSKPSLVWRALGSAPRADMKTIMAEAENQKNVGSHTPPSTGLGANEIFRWPHRTSPRTGSDVVSASRTPPGSVWKASITQISAGFVDSFPTSSSMSKQSPPPPSSLARTRPEPPTTTSPNLRPVDRSGTTQVRQPPATPPSGPTKDSPHQGLGPVFTPLRKSPHKPSSRVVSGGNPWTAPIVTPAVSPSPGAAISFAAIQLMQQEDFSPINVKRSLKEIQEEEQAQRAEQEFLKWWAAEEERVRMENEVAAHDVASGRGGKRSNATRKGYHRKAQQQKGEGKETNMKKVNPL